MALEESLLLLTKISSLLLIGILLAALARKMRISNVLFLLIGGLFIGSVTDIFSFSPTFLIALAVLTLAMVVFQGTANMTYRQVDSYSMDVFKLTGWYISLTTLLVGLFSYVWFFHATPNGIVLALILAVALAGTDPSSVLLITGQKTSAMIRMLTVEAVVNTPIVVLIPFILIDILSEPLDPTILFAILQQLVVGIGAGMVIGIAFFRVLRRFYSKDLSPVAVLTGMLLAYIVAENGGGSGVLSVATLGLLFGNLTIKKKEELQNFSFELSSLLETLIFLLIGIIIGSQISITGTFLFQGLLLFSVLLLARFLAVYTSLRSKYDWPQIIFCSVTMPKGIAVAVLIFSFSVLRQIPPIVLSLLFIVTIYSILAATISSFWWEKRTSTT